MTTETLFPNDEPLRFKIIRPVYKTLTVNDAAAEYFEPLEAISSSAHVTRLFEFLSRETREHFWAVHLDSKNKLLCLNPVSTGSLYASIVHPRDCSILTGTRPMSLSTGHMKTQWTRLNPKIFL
ncbi:MAG: hypothetical protein GQ530_07725 [Desulfuromonadales bacterium]|nr:hypothetical protein [Desulfuromonadales bacterium]